jgi:DNA processing protein
MDVRYLYSALNRVNSVSTSSKARLLGHPDLLLRIRSGETVPEVHPSLSKAVAILDWEAALRDDKAMESQGIRILTWADEAYPDRLRSLPDPPPALYVRGRLETLKPPAIAVVGSRLSTVYGLGVARSLAGDLVRAGLCVVSGLARGIDTAAHEGSLSAAGRALAVLGTGHDTVYPKENEGLQRRILEAGGVILTEFPPGTPPHPRNFPQRNRVIAGLAWGVLVVEATERSGSLITARFAAETGREVFAVPHNLTSRTGIGPNSLIQRGAKLVLQVSDILEELPEGIRAALQPEATDGGDDPETPDLPEESRRILAHLVPDAGRSVDTLCAATGLPAAEVLARLFELQMGGHCVELPGMRYALQRAHREPT